MTLTFQFQCLKVLNVSPGMHTAQVAGSHARGVVWQLLLEHGQKGADSSHAERLCAHTARTVRLLPRLAKIEWRMKQHGTKGSLSPQKSRVCDQ